MKQGRLPENFPGHAELAAANTHTFAQVRGLKGDYSEVPGIGPVKGSEIDAALLAVEEPTTDESGEFADAGMDEEAESEAPIITPDLDLEDLKSRAAFAKPRNEALMTEIASKLAMAQQCIGEATEMLDKVIHVELS